MSVTMNIKCGSCKGRHGTVAEVKACYAKGATPTYAIRPGHVYEKVVNAAADLVCSWPTGHGPCMKPLHEIAVWNGRLSMIGGTREVYHAWVHADGTGHDDGKGQPSFDIWPLPACNRCGAHEFETRLEAYGDWSMCLTCRKETWVSIGD